MRIDTRRTLCLLSLAACFSSLAAQTFTFGPAKTAAYVPNQFPEWPAPPFTVQTADINGDGKTDLAILWNAGTEYLIYFGDGKGGFVGAPFSGSTLDPAPIVPPPMLIDVDGDGIADQVYGFSTYFDPTYYASTNGQFDVALGDGQGNLNITTMLWGMPAGTGSADDPLVAADFNGDGMVDFALLTGGGTDYNGDPEPQPAAITLFLNRGKGAFEQLKTIWLEGTGHWAMVAGDFNGDGKQDLAWTQLQSGAAPPYPIHYMYGNGDGTFGEMHTYWADTAPVALASGDLNGDHKTDLVVALSPGGPHTWRIATLLAKQKGGFYWAKDVSSNVPTDGLELMDLNNDGRLDAIYHQNYMRAGLAGGGWGPHQVVPGQAQSYGPFAPLVKGGLPAVFSSTVDSSGNVQVNVQINTSK